MIAVIRRLVEETGARTVVGAVTAAGADVVDPGIAREIAAGLIRTPRRTATAAAEACGIAKTALMATAHHSTDAVHQKPAADHAGSGCRSGTQKRAATAAHRSLRGAIGLAVLTLVVLSRTLSLLQHLAGVPGRSAGHLGWADVRHRTA